MRLTGKRILITGASSGLGRAMAIGFAGEGASLALAARTVSALDETVAACQAAGASAIGIPANVTDGVSVQAMVDRAVAGLGGLDVLVNNAGIGPYNAGVRDTFDARGSILEVVPKEEWDRILAVNLTGVVHCLRSALPVLDPGASVINITSISARFLSANGSAYMSSKFALDALTRWLAAEQPAIRVNGLCPGATVDTGFFSNVPNRDSFAAEAGPDVIVPAAIFLASDESADITGQIYYGKWFNDQVAALGAPPQAGMP